MDYPEIIRIERRGGPHNLRHGHTQKRNGKVTVSPTYKTWDSMKQRCLNSNNDHFTDYGGRGIQICPRWLEAFDNFLSDMGERPVGMTIERLNVNGNYEPTNCVWATAKQQRANRRDSKRRAA